MRILLYRGTGLINALIRWQTRSHYAHAAILHGSVVYESLPKTGVRLRVAEPSDFSGDVDHFDVNAGYSPVWIAVCLNKFLGRKYDFLGVARFLSRQKEENADRTFFCSELVYEVFKLDGVKLLNCEESWKISPAILALSPYLERISDDEKIDTAARLFDSNRVAV